MMKIFREFNRCIIHANHFTSPQTKIGMVQICSECNAKHVNSAETMTDKHSDSGRSLTFGNGGRFSPSDSKSQANSDSSFVRFKVILIHANKRNERFLIHPEQNH